MCLLNDKPKNMSFSEQTKIANDFGKHDMLSTYNCAVLTILEKLVLLVNYCQKFSP